MTLDTSPKTQGEPSIEAVASGLGTLGRYGDNYMVHAAEGETIVPREVLEQNPGLKEDLFRQMTMMGIENPNRYVVGDQLNSINPITGQPEFFFKKIFRAIKKVVKKAAPIIVPMLGNMILPGIGGLLASGLYTKAQGGSWGDALKAAGMAYLGNVASAGIMGGINAPSGQFFDGFSTGIGRGITAPYDAVRGLIQGGSASPFSQGVFGKSTVPGMLKQYDTKYLDIPSASDMNIQTAANPGAVPAAPVASSPSVSSEIPTFKEMGIDTAANPGAVPAAQVAPTTLGAEKTFKITSGQTANDFPPGSKVTSGDKTYLVKRVLTKDGSRFTNTLVEAPSGIGKFYQENIKGPVANIVGEKAANPVILGGGALLASAFSKDPPPPPKNASQQQMAAYDAYLAEFAQNPNMSEDRHKYLRGLSGIIPQFTRSQLANIIQRDVRRMPGYRFVGAGGGEVMGPGTGTSDSIPARLSDGEFVMTARAVENAGGGNRSLGAARMYDMMNRFEQGAA